MQVFAALVGVVLGALPVLLVGVEILAVYGCENHYLFRRVHTLHLIHRYVYPAAVGVFVHAHILPFAHRHGLGLAVTVHHLFLFLFIPFAEWHTVVVVVGAHQYYYRVHRVAVLRHQLVGLPRYVVPLPAAYGINVRRYAEPFLQQSPVFVV